MVLTKFYAGQAVNAVPAGFMYLVSSQHHRNYLDEWDYLNDVLAWLLVGETDYQRLLP